jgi:DNA-binding XRE family transcriptional regulator
MVRDPDGYLQISMTRNGKVITPRVHKLTLAAFVGPKAEGQQCRHLDGDRTNNRIENLAWGSHAENEADKDRHGTRPYGDAHGNAKLTAEKVREVRRLLTLGMTQLRIAIRMGVSEPTIGMIATGRNWKHVR